MNLFALSKIIIASAILVQLVGCFGSTSPAGNSVSYQNEKRVTSSQRPPSHETVFERKTRSPDETVDRSSNPVIDPVVVATGMGVTPEEAKLDAVRNALSQKFDQFIFAEREVVDDDLRRDVIISTMNGFVRDIEVVNATQEGGFFVIVASVTVSGKALENYIARFVPISKISETRSRINASEVASRLEKARELNFLEAQKRKTQWDSAGQLAKKLFEGYPSQLISGRLEELSFNERVPDILMLRFSYGLNPIYAENLMQQLTLIDRLVTDSGRPVGDYRYLCFSSLKRLGPSNCARIPKGIVALEQIYAARRGVTQVDHKLVVAVFDQFDRYVDCIYTDINDGHEDGVNSFESKAPLSRYPSEVVTWVGTNDVVQRITTDKTHFENLIFLNGFRAESETAGVLKTRWTIETKAYAPTFFNEKKSLSSEHFYPFVVIKQGANFYLDLQDSATSTQKVETLCQEEGRRRHLSIMAR